MSNLIYNFECDRLEQAYTDILIHIYAYEIQRIIFNDFGGGFNEEYVQGLVERQCFGCQFNCSSQKHHDICLLPFQDQIEFLFDFALAEINQEKVTEEFHKSVLEKQLPFVNSQGKFKYFLDENWRKYCFIEREGEYLLEQVICIEHLSRYPTHGRLDLNRKG